MTMEIATNIKKVIMKTNAQSIVEYVLLVGILIMALIASFRYLVKDGNGFEKHFKTAIRATTGEDIGY